MKAETAVLIIFLVFFVIHEVVERVLAVLNARYIQAHSGQVPETLKGAFPEDYPARSAAYSLARTSFGHVSAVSGGVLTLAYLFSGIIPWLAEHVQRLQLGPLTGGVVLLGAFAIGGGILDLPLDWYATFHLEARFGFNQTTVRTFWIDKLKAALLGLVIGVPFLYALLAFISHTGEFWWLWAALFVIAFQLVMMVLYPVLIAPLFNKFTPLADGELKQTLEALAQKCRFATRGIFVMDGSKHSAHSNAYFTGLGRARRIVLFDTLIQQMTVPELASVLAHEIGHYKKKHIPKMLALSIVLTLAGFYALSLLMYWPPLYAAFGVGAPTPAVGLLLFTPIAGHLTFWAGPCFNRLSRKYEYQADAYAAEQTAAPSMESALIKLFEKNLSALTPHPAYSAYHYSHPTLLERVGALRRQV